MALFYPIVASTRINSFRDEVSWAILLDAIGTVYPGVGAGNPFGLKASDKLNALRDEVTLEGLASFIKTLSVEPPTDPSGSVKAFIPVNHTDDSVTLANFVAYLVAQGTITAPWGPTIPLDPREAPEIGFPEDLGPTEYPIRIWIEIGPDSYPGDVLKLLVSLNYDLSDPMTIAHTITAGEAVANEIALGLSSLPPNIYYFGANINDGDMSNIISHGDTVAPIMTSASTQSGIEIAPMDFTVTLNEGAYITLGGTNAVLLEVFGSQPNNTYKVRLVGNANMDYETRTTYAFTLQFTDPSGNQSSVYNCTQNVLNNPSDDPAPEYPAHPGASVDKNWFLATSGSPRLELQGTYGLGTPQMARLSAPANAGNVVTFKHVVTEAPHPNEFILIGWDNGAQDLQGSAIPGHTDNSSTSMRISAVEFGLFANSTFASSGGSPGIQVGDEIITSANKTTGVVSYSHKRGGTTTNFGTVTVASPFVNWRGIGGHVGDNKTLTNLTGY